MKINITEECRIICSNQNYLHNYFGWPTVARLQDGSLMMVASGFRAAHVCPFGKLIGKRSYNEGETWTAPEILVDTPLDERDGGIMTFGEKGVIVTTFNAAPRERRGDIQAPPTYVHAYLDAIEKHGGWEEFCGSLISISHDGGVSFGDPIVVPISSPHGPCELSDGRILYVGGIDHNKEAGRGIECHIIDPSDGSAERISAIDEIDPGVLSCEPYATQLKSGRIVVHFRAQTIGGNHWKNGLFTIFQSASDDGGKTFSPPRQILADRGGAPAHLIEHSSGVLISVYGYRERPYGVRAMFSYDGGETWDTDNILVAGEPSGDLGYPSSVEVENGDILTVFYSRRDAGKESVIKQIKWSFER